VRLTRFWGYLAPDLDGVVRMQPSSVHGFNLKEFVRAAGLRIDLEQPRKALRKRLLDLIGEKWGSAGVLVIKGLLP
jgi:hypothetical protein